MKGIKSDRPIYGLIEKHLKANKQSMTCNAPMEIDEIRTAALDEFGGPERSGGAEFSLDTLSLKTGLRSLVFFLTCGTRHLTPMPNQSHRHPRLLSQNRN